MNMIGWWTFAVSLGLFGRNGSIPNSSRSWYSVPDKFVLCVHSLIEHTEIKHVSVCSNNRSSSAQVSSESSQMIWYSSRIKLLCLSQKLTKCTVLQFSNMLESTGIAEYSVIVTTVPHF